MTTSENEVPETTAPAEKTQTHSGQSASAGRVIDKRADALRAKKKKKRTAHRVALRRSHTGG